MMMELFREPRDRSGKEALACSVFSVHHDLPRESNAQPNTGIRASSFLNTQWNGWGMVIATAKGSAMEVWFAMKTYGQCGSICSNPRWTTDPERGVDDLQ
jgi:hypothetical protein